VIPGADLVHEKAVRAHAARGGDALVGRKLWQLLTRAGLTNVEIEAVVKHSGTDGIQSCYTQFDPNRLLPLVHAKVVSDEEYNRYAEGVRAFMASPDAFYMNVLFVACGEKPSH
jgi:hypothetical protein